MKKSKLLTLFGVMLAMGITACSGTTNPSDSKQPSANPSSQPQPSQSSGGDKSSSTPSSQSSSTPAPSPAADPEGHKFGADEDIAAGAEAGTVAYKKAACEDNDGAIRLKVNQSVVTYASGSSRKSGTPDGYTKLSSNNQSFSFKFELDNNYTGNLYFFGCMDGWSTEGNRDAGFYRQGTPSAKVEVNGVALDASAQQDKKYRDYFGEEQIDTDLSSPSDHLSVDGYAPFAPVTLKKGVNEVKYTRVQTQNMLIKDFVFIVQEAQEWGPAQDVAADAEAGTVAYSKSVNNFDGRVKIEWKSLDGTLAEGSANKDGTPEGFLKLASNGQSISYKFNFDANLDGKLYQRGAMDQWASNHNTTYFSQTKGAKYGNFEVKLNESTVYYGDKRDVKYVDMLGEGDNAELEGYSEVKDCEIGEAYIKNGENNMKFTRVDSYNLAVSHFVFIGKAGNAHTAPAVDAPYVTTDEDSFWQASPEAADTFKYNRSEYRWEDDPDKEDTVSDCKTHGIHYEKCAVSGKTREVELPLADHTWVDDPDKEDVVATTCDGHGIHYEVCSVCGEHREVETPSTVAHNYVAGEKVGGATPYTCSVCGAKYYEMAMEDTSNNVAAQKLKSDALWDITGIEAGTYAVCINACGKSTTLSQEILSNGVGRYQFRIGEGDYVNPTSGTYGSFGLGTGENVASCQWSTALCQVAVPEGAAQFEIHWTNVGYSLFINGARLVKIA